ncbi:MFS transporter [Micromonospora sp. NPDC047557]|uniref:MFS transporter n=1 Tax=Micromonospora sp. NPDC047557 TaxID=3364250 RepID=UPI0037160925
MSAGEQVNTGNRSAVPFWTVLTAHGISLTGNAMTILAVPWFVLTLTGSATQTGLTAAIAFLPMVLGLTLGGAVVDRVGHRRASIVCDLVAGVMIGLIPVLHRFDALSFPTLLLLVFVAALFDTPGNTGRQAMLPDLAEQAAMPIERATSFLGVLERSARMVGAPLAGVLIAVMGPVNVLVLDAATFLVSALLVALVRVPGTGRPAAAASGYLAELKEGFAFTAREPLLRAIALLLAVTNVLDVAYSTVVIPVYADEVLSGAGSAGLLIGTSAFAAVLGGLAFGTYGMRLPRWQLFGIAFALVGVPRCLILAAEPGLPVLLVVVVATGFCSGVLNPILSSAAYQRTPADLRARVLGAVFSGAFALVPLGPLLGGVLLAGGGLRTTLWVFAAGYALAAATVFTMPVWRTLGRPPAATTATGTERPA